MTVDIIFYWEKLAGYKNDSKEWELWNRYLILKNGYTSLGKFSSLLCVVTENGFTKMIKVYLDMQVIIPSSANNTLFPLQSGFELYSQEY